MITKSIVVVLVLYLLLLAATYYFQNKLVFKPETVPQDYDFDLGEDEEEVFLKTADGTTIHGIFLHQSESKGVILYLHGNAQCLKDWWYLSGHFRDFGYDVLMIDYRGYGKSEGTMTEEGLYQDGKAGYQYLLNQGYQEEDIIIYGVSIGSGVAMELASQKAAKGLILEAPFLSLTKIAWEHFPYLLPNLLLRFRFDNFRKAEKINIPILIFHGDVDQVIPPEHGQQIAELFPTEDKKLVLIPAGTHSDIPEHLEYHLELEKYFKRLDEKKAVNS